MNLVRRHLHLYGRVQMVGFRYFAIRVARRYGVSGIVRNTSDGAVEIVVEGEPSAISAFIEEVKPGPPAAHVSRVEILEEPPTGEFKNFSVAY